MNFKEIKELAINLYKQGKTEDEIKNLCKVPITNDMIASWIQESEEIEKSKKLAKLYKKMQKIKKIVMTPKNKESVVSNLQQIALQILEIEENSQIAMNELVRCFSIQREYELGRNYGIKILENNPRNIFALYNMAKLEMSAGNYEKSLEYNKRLLEIDSQNSQGLIQKKKIEENKRQKEEKIKEEKLEEQVRKIEKEEQEIIKQIKQERIDIETEQKEFAKKEERKLYTKENKEVYMQYLQKMFYEGKLDSTNIEKIKQELYLYPNQVESAIFISEIYYLITEKEEKAIQELEDFIDSQYTLTPKMYHDLQERISNFRGRLQVREQTEKQEVEQDKINKEIRIKQRKYMMNIAKNLNEGKINKEEVDDIVKKLEKCQDRDKAIYLIIKIYENIYGKEEALKAIEKYSRINNITEQEKALIVKMKISTNLQEKPRKTREEKIKDRINKKKKNEKYTKQILKSQIRKLIAEGKSVREIYEEMKEIEYVSLKSISKIKSGFLKENEEAMQNYNENVELAIQFLKDGYSIEQVYDLFDYNIGKSVLYKLNQQIKGKER